MELIKWNNAKKAIAECKTIDEVKQIIKDKAGIYFIYSNNELIYIGQSKDIYKRLVTSEKMKYINKHYKNISFKFESYVFKYERLLKEKEYIKLYKPFLNGKLGKLNSIRKITDKEKIKLNNVIDMILDKNKTIDDMIGVFNGK